MGVLSSENELKQSGNNSGVINHDIRIEDDGKLISENNIFHITINHPTIVLLMLVVVAMIVFVALIATIKVRFWKK